MSRRISSLRPWQQGGGGGIGGGAVGFVTLYDNRNFRGQAFRVDTAQQFLSSFANRAESVRVSGGLWELCDQNGYGGRCVVVSSDVSDLNALGLRNRVSSVRPAVIPR
jgi:hypothetical protein